MVLSFFKKITKFESHEILHDVMILYMKVVVKN
jgi:hypothetical protein